MEDFEANLHLLFGDTQLFALHLELVDSVERLLIILRLELFNEFLGSHAVELLAVLRDKALEFFHVLLHALLKGLLALVNDVLGLGHAESEVLPLLVDVEEQGLIVLSQLVLASAEITELVIHDELELLLYWIDLALKLRAAVVDLLPLVLVLLELLLVLALLGEFLHGVFQLVDEIYKLTLRLLDQVTEDVSDRSVALLHQLSLQVRGLEDNKLLRTRTRPVLAYLIDDIKKCFNSILVLGNGIIGSSVRFEEAHLTTVSPERGQMADFWRHLPHLAVLVHLLLDRIDDLLYGFLDLIDLLCTFNLLIVVMIASLG